MSFTNLSRLIGQCMSDDYGKDYLKYAVVKNGVVSVTNGKCLIRRPVPGIPDGKYHFGFGDQLIPDDELSATKIIGGYPDIDLVLPKPTDLSDTNKFSLLGTIRNDMVDKLIAFAHRLKLENKEYERGWQKKKIHLTQYGFCERQNIEVSKGDGEIDIGEQYRIEVPVNLSVGEHDFSFDVDLMCVALVELKHFQAISILRKNVTDSNEPLFIGASLDHCAIIIPTNVEKVDGQYIR